MAEQNNNGKTSSQQLPPKTIDWGGSFGNHTIPNPHKPVPPADGTAGESTGGALDKVEDAAKGALGKILGALPGQKPFHWPGIAIPPAFPEAPGGRLPTSISSIMQNRGSPEYKDGKGKPIPPCQKLLKICFFFDGTNNHEKADKAVSGAEVKPTTGKPSVRAKQIPPYAYPRTTNVARLFHACMGAGGSVKQ